MGCQSSFLPGELAMVRWYGLKLVPIAAAVVVVVSMMH